MSKYPLAIPLNIKAEMARRGITQREVAEKLNLDQARVSDRLAGKAKLSADELAKIADLLDVSASVLIGEPTQAAS